MKKLLSLFLIITLCTAIIPAGAAENEISEPLASEVIEPPYSVDFSGLAVATEVTQTQIDELLQKSQAYSALSEDEQAQINRYYKVRTDTMTACAQAGYAIADSVPLAQMMQGLDLPLADIETMIAAFGSVEAAKEQADAFVKNIYRHSAFGAGTPSSEKMRCLPDIPPRKFLQRFASHILCSWILQMFYKMGKTQLQNMPQRTI